MKSYQKILLSIHIVEFEIKEQNFFVYDLAKSVVIEENNTDNNVSEWMDCVIIDPGFKQAKDEGIIKEVLGINLEKLDKEDGKYRKI